ncbi:MAG: prepilin-type N-terminal cleavage/methylation domain-containing protein [Planctomycetota bacterium]
MSRQASGSRGERGVFHSWGFRTRPCRGARGRTNGAKTGERIGRKVRGVTLMEVLVVVAIMGMLMAILMPALGKATESARSANCKSNLRQIGIAMIMYVSENRGWYAPATSSDNNYRWHGVRTSSTEPFDPRKGPLSPYLQGGEVKKCPSFEPDLTEGEYAFASGCGGYGYNDQYVGGSPLKWPAFYKPAKQSQIAFLSETVMFSDTALLGSNVGDKYRIIEYSFLTAPFYEAYDNRAATPSTHFRHGGKANVIFCDGHVATMCPACRMSVNPRYGTVDDFKRARIGFLGEDNSIFDRE